MGLLRRVMLRVMLLVAWPLAAKRFLDPEVEESTQIAWASNATRVLDLDVAAQLVAEGIWPVGEGHDEALRQGYGGERFSSLFQMAQGVPELADLRRMFDRGTITSQQYEYALRRMRLENQWHDALKELDHERLSPADIANAVQQGFLPNPGLLPVSPPSGGGQVPSPGPVGIDPVKEAAASGIDHDRLEVLARLAGLPPGPQELLEMYRRGVIDRSDVLRGIAEGHTKTEWGDAYLGTINRPLSAAELATLVVKKWITEGDAHERARAAGISTDNLDLLILGTGRPPAPGQLQQAYNRGLIDKDRFEKGIAESDLRTQWADVHFGLRVRYPSAFALRQLLTSKAISPDEGADILQKEGWPADLATKVAHAWHDQKAERVKTLAEGQIATLYEARFIDRGQAQGMLNELGYDGAEQTYLLELADARRVTRFLNTAVGKLHTLYINHRIGDTDATSGLGALGISSEAVGDLMATWRLERDVNAPTLTPAQIAAAVYYDVIARETGLQLLRDRGYSDHDAEVVIDVRMHGRPEGTAQL